MTLDREKIEELKDLRSAIDAIISDYENNAFRLERRPQTIEERQFFKIYDFRVRYWAIKRLEEF